MSADKNFPINVVIPAYNEESGIAEVLDGIHAVLKQERVPYEILVVDDGSSDRTAALALQKGARVLRHPANMGYGKSLMTGFAHAQQDWVLMMDADGSYPPEEIRNLLPYARDFEMVVGARQGTHFWGNPFQALLRWMYLKIAKFVVGEAVPDANSGLRLIRRSALEGAFPVPCLGYSFSTTMTLSFLKSGRFVKFVPIAYRTRRGRSKVRRWRDIPRTLQVMTQVILYFNPLKLAAVLAAAPLGVAAALAVLDFWRGGLLGWSLASLYFSLLIFWLGCLIEAVKMNRE